VADPVRTSGELPEQDLRALIEARVAQRRRDGADAGHGVDAPDMVDGVDGAGASPQALVRAGANPTEPADLVATPQRAPAHRLPANTRLVDRRRRERPAGRHGRPSRKKAAGGIRLVFLMVCTLISVVLLRTFVVASFYIPSGSMEPTLHGCDGCQPDLVVVDKLSYRFGHVARSDVVVFDRPPLAPTKDKELIKRVVGLPGETVSAHGGHVYVGDRVLNEPYLNPACPGIPDFAPVTVPANEYFMMGDNRCDSFDSRRFGPVPRSTFVGRAFAVVWPLKHIRWL
jgi:signal peptidase I